MWDEILASLAPYLEHASVVVWSGAAGQLVGTTRAWQRSERQLPPLGRLRRFCYSAFAGWKAAIGSCLAAALTVELFHEYPWSVTAAATLVGLAVDVTLASPAELIEETARTAWKVRDIWRPRGPDNSQPP